jgi:hypothetical protein
MLAPKKPLYEKEKPPIQLAYTSPDFENSSMLQIDE